MKQEQDIWVPITKVESSDLLVCTYGGPFAQSLQLNQYALRKFLDVASLDGMVLLKESTVKKPRAIPEINPDGSVAGKRGLRWGEKISQDETRRNPYFQLEADDAGWIASINGGLILDDLTEKGLSVREAQRPFVGKFNSLLRESLQKALLKDKCTFTKDPWVIGRLNSTLFYSFLIIRDSTKMEFASLPYTLITYLTLMALINTAGRKSTEELFHYHLSSAGYFINRFFTFHRRTTKNAIETFAPPFEIDRLVRGLGYLQYQRLRGNPLVRFAALD